MYEMEDYDTCDRENNVYCKIKLVLIPNDASNKLWQVIEASKKEKRFMERDVIYRAKCIPKEYFIDTARVLAHVTEQENKNLENISFHVKVEKINCKENVQELSVNNYFILWLLLSYLLLIVLATSIDLLVRRTNYILDIPKQKLITVLSVISNWEALRKPIRSADYDKLKSFQGYRIFVMCVVIGCHSMLAAVTAYSTNIRLLEDYSLSTFKRVLINFGLHMIQPSFLISGWLLTIQVYKTVERSNHKKLKLNMIGRALVARYLRFILPLMFYLGLQKSHLLQLCFSGPQTDLLDVDSKACETYWWANLLLVNNFFYVKNMCNVSSWYLSCDFQALLVCMALFYLMYKYNVGIKLFGIVLLLIGIVNAYVLYHAYTVYGVETEVTYLARAEELKLDKFIENDLLYIYHTSSFTNFGSYIVGVLFGAIYYRYKNAAIKINKVTTTIWILGHFGLQALVVTLSLYNYSPFTAAVIGSLLKPLFSVGIGIGILGMSHNIGGLMKRVFESYPLEFVSRWIFSVYIFHLPLIFYRSSTWTYMPELSYLFLIKIVSTDILLSFALGLIMHLIVERPLLNIVHIIITKWSPNPKTN
ncbi:O-acyltransferase like protein-like [Anoplophora glabripennis]|uniref:O-acyltransferase like protein-like n=1 Tax=Anoplophora glabripennis TaxID=217634 RepID=UPI000C76BD9F|nr:O-acyltransferase like protein-like [Anoplophora glabripennis]